MPDNARKAPTLPGPPLLGNLLSMRRDPLGTLRAALRECGDVSILRLGLHHVHLLVLPEHIEQVLLDPRYEKRFRVYRKMRIVLGDGLVTSNGEAWRAQRQLAQPAFHRSRIAGFGAAMARAAESMCDGWREGKLDVFGEMLRLALQIIAETLFGAQGAAARAEEIAAALGEASRQLSRRMLDIVDLPLWLPTPANRRLFAALRALDVMVRGFIADRRREKVEREDLLGMLISARDPETGAGMEDTHLRDELMTIFVAGQETVACALSWSFWLLSQHPEAEQALHEELASVLGGRAPSLEDLPRLPWTLMVLQEALRLYPPLWLLNRTAREEDEIGGYRIRKGSHVFFSPYLTHRHPALWDHPDDFRPQRFVQAPRRFSYLPFSGGPRQCIGHNFAMLEAQLVLATVAQRWRLSALPGHPAVPDPAVTLRPRDSLPMALTRR